MNLTDIYTIKEILRENRIKPNKRLGQNFLIDRGSLDKLIESAQIKADDTIVEIGPGLGVITQELAKKAKLVLAIEKDYKLVQWLRKYFKSYKNVKIIHDDILRFQITNVKFPMSNQCQNPNVKKETKKLQATSYKIVSALPYSITSPVIRRFLENKHQASNDRYQLESMHLIVQKEVAERICAKPGNSERGFLTVLVEFFAQAEIINYIDRTCFWPSPKVDSAILRIELKSQNLNLKSIEPNSFFRLAKAGFSQKRRQIHNPLRANFHISKEQIFDILKKAVIDPKMRAEEVTLEDWVKLYKIISKFKF